MKSIAAIVVTFNGEKWIQSCFSGLILSPSISHIFVIDNGSSDDTIALIKAIGSRKVFLFQNKKNIGFGRANNIGIRYALNSGADGVLLINQDAWLLDDGLERLVNTLEKTTHLGIVSPVHFDGSGRVLDTAFANYLSGVLSPEQKTKMICKTFENPFIEIRFVNAACWLMSVNCIKRVGLFDTLFTHYGEDNNFLERARYHGIGVAIVPNSFLIHDRQGREKNRFHMFAETRFRVYLLLLLDINVPIYNCMHSTLRQVLHSCLDAAKTKSYLNILTELYLLVKSFTYIPIILIHRGVARRSFWIV